MTPAELRGWRNARGLSVPQAARLLDTRLSHRTWEHWEAGGKAHRAPPPYLWRALRDLERELRGGTNGRDLSNV